MSKAVMLSVRPEWCEKICSGEKTIEVRKTRPKLDTPFKCYIYRTKGFVPHIINGKWVKMEVGGTVIGEFTCDAITRVNICGFWDDSGKQLDNRLKETCLTTEEFCKYLGENVGYGWHISNLKIYDTPKKLSEFKGLCKVESDCCACPYYNYSKMDCDGRTIKRPPQSWCYVEAM
jgi:predicted transcriptional regulator